MVCHLLIYICGPAVETVTVMSHWSPGKVRFSLRQDTSCLGPVDNFTQMNGKPWYGQKDCHGVTLCPARGEILYNGVILCLIHCLPLCPVSPHPILSCWLWHWCGSAMSHFSQLTTERRRRNHSSCSCGSTKGEAQGWDALDCQALCSSPPKKTALTLGFVWKVVFRKKGNTILRLFAISCYWGFTIFVVQVIEKQLNLIQKAADLALSCNNKIWVRKDWNKKNTVEFAVLNLQCRIAILPILLFSLLFPFQITVYERPGNLLLICLF